MKRIEEIGISEFPWHSLTNYHGNSMADAFVCSMSGELLCGMARGESADNDQRLMKEAPNLYDCLREAVELRCNGCRHEDGRGGACTKTIGECFAQRWRSTLAEAAGEEPANA